MGAEREKTPEASPEAKLLLGGASALQAVILAIGTSNGAIKAMAVNNLTLLLVGLGLVALAVLCGVLLTIGRVSDAARTVTSVVGVIALFAGIGLTGYIAVKGPSIANAPNVNVALTGTAGHFSLTGEVKVSGIRQDAHYWVEVDARQYKVIEGAGAYWPLGTPLYQAQLGANSEGDIDSSFAVPVTSRQYPAVSVEAWYGTKPGPCGSLTIPGGANLTKGQSKAVLDASNSSRSKHIHTLEDHSATGCVVVRLPQ